MSRLTALQRRAVVDGIGHSPRIAAVARLLAAVTARVSARRGCLAGLLTATELVADPGVGDEPEPDAVVVVAVAEPSDDLIRVAWVGDCRAYALTDGRLRLCTVDHNLAEQLTMCGYSGEITKQAAQWVRTTVATAAVATVGEAWTDGPLVMLTSDGVHGQMRTMPWRPSSSSTSTPPRLSPRPWSTQRRPTPTERGTMQLPL
jgi:serine/threonine protein phosphatase PrpC